MLNLMQNTIAFLSQLFPILMPILWSIFIMIKWPDFWKFIKDLFSESAQVSSRRFISIAATIVLLWLCIYAQVHRQNVPEQVLVILLILIFTSTGWATMPLIIKVIGMVKGMIPGGGDQTEKETIKERVSYKETEIINTSETKEA